MFEINDSYCFSLIVRDGNINMNKTTCNTIQLINLGINFYSPHICDFFAFRFFHWFLLSFFFVFVLLVVVRVQFFIFIIFSFKCYVSTNKLFLICHSLIAIRYVDFTFQCYIQIDCFLLFNFDFFRSNGM